MTGIPNLMQAVLAQPEGALRLVQVSTPQPGPGEVLVRVVASAINPLDVKILAGTAEHARQALPTILGIDVAGIVVAVGDGTTKFQEGDAVYGMAGGVGGCPGSLAEYIAADARLLARKHHRPGHGQGFKEVCGYWRVGLRPVQKRSAGGPRRTRDLLRLSFDQRQSTRFCLYPLRIVTRTPLVVP